MIFANRHDAGRRLAQRVRLCHASLAEPLAESLALGIARGGAVVAAAMAAELGCQWDVILPRKIPSPHNPEVAIGAVAEDGGMLLDSRAAEAAGADEAYLERTTNAVMQEIRRRAELYRGQREPAALAGRNVLLVDDGIATGYTVAAAARDIRRRGPRRLTLAVPVAAPESLVWLAREVDEVVCLVQPRPFYAVSQAYEDFDQVEDAWVAATLRSQAPTERR
jgi:predicted phosphoribosyltransferase